MRDLVEADEMALLGMTEITSELYDGFHGKVSYALDHFDTVFVFYCHTEEMVENLKSVLSTVKQNYSDIHSEQAKEDIENSKIISPLIM